MSNKKKIAIFIDWFLPGYKAGGPITSVSNIIKHLNDEFEFYIITSDRDLGDKETYKNEKINSWTNKNSYNIIYLSPDKQNKKTYRQILSNNNFDYVYFNSLFSVKFTLLPLLEAKKILKHSKIIISPRGMLGAGALQIKSTKKSIFILISKILKIYSNITWHATNKAEAEEITKNYEKKAIIKIAQNIPNITDYKIKNFNSEIKFVFFSRISQKKNLKYALQILSKISADNNIIFDIIGPIEDEQYWLECSKLINKISNIKITYIGHIDNSAALKTLQNYHFLLLPTLHENFGHSIFDAMIAGCPIIISNNTPWQNLEEKKIGWDIDLKNQNKFIEIIEKCSNISEKEYQIMSKNVYEFAQNYFNNSDLINQTKQLFNE